MRRCIILLLIFVAITTVSLGQSAIYVERSKKVERHYNVSPLQPLFIDNQFGNVYISTWNKNEIKVEINMSGRSKTKEQAEKILSLLGFEEDTTLEGGVISLKTIIKNEGPLGNGISAIFSNQETKYEAEITYNIIVPENSPLEIINNFGNVSIHNVYKGRLWLDVYCGVFDADSLIGQPKNIKIGRSKQPNHIGYIEKGKITAAEGYGTLVVDRAGDIDVVGFDTLKCKYVNHLCANRMGGWLSVDTAESIDGDITNANVDIGSLTKAAHLIFNNSPNVHIRSIGSKDMGLFFITSSNGNLNLHLNEHAIFSVDMQQTDIKFTAPKSFTEGMKRIDDRRIKFVQGGGVSKLNLRSSNGKLTIY